MKKLIALILALLMVPALMTAAATGTTVHTSHNWRLAGRKEPTCTQEGYAVYTCTCGEKKVEQLPALGHEFSRQVYVSPADCTHYGVFYWECERCGAHSATGNDKPLGHDWTEWVIIKRAAPDEEGMQQRRCTRCGETEKRACAFDSDDPGYTPRENGDSAHDTLDLLRQIPMGAYDDGSDFGMVTGPESGKVSHGEKLEISFMELNSAGDPRYLELDFNIVGGLPPYHIEVYYRGLIGGDEYGPGLEDQYAEALAKERDIEKYDPLVKKYYFIVDADYDFFYKLDSEWRQAHDCYHYKLVVKDSGGQEASADNYEESYFE